MENEEKEFEKIFNMSEDEINKKLIEFGYDPKKIEEEAHLSKLAKKIISAMRIRIDELEKSLAQNLKQPVVSINEGNQNSSIKKTAEVALPTQKQRHDEMEKIADLFTDEQMTKRRNFVRGWRECESYLLPFIR